MSNGGFISTMITSLKNNRALLKNIHERRKYAMQHHSETSNSDPKVSAKPSVNKIALQAFRKKHKRDIEIEKSKLLKVYFTTSFMAILLFLLFYFLLF